MRYSIKEEFQRKIVSAEEAVQCVKSGQTVYIGTCTSTAYELARALGQRADELSDITIGCSNILKPLEIFERPDTFHCISYFMGPTERRAMKDGNVDFTSLHLSRIDVFCKQTCPPDVAFIEVSLPDEDGNMSFGAAGVALHQFIVDEATTVILQINKYVPYVFGEHNRINISECDIAIRYDEELGQIPELPLTPEVDAITDYIVDEIPDGACLQLGIGAIGNAVGYKLLHKNDLGIHTELMTDSLADLIKNGNVTNKMKGFMPGKSLAAFTLGTSELYRFLDHNENMYYMPFTVVNDSTLIAANENMISVNSAIVIDLLGQVDAENIAGRQYSGVGGQLDFVRGAQMAKGGKSFICATSTNTNKKTGKKNSRIVSTLPRGTAITTPRSDVQYVATEYGCVNLKPLTMRERAHALISLAHPDFRPQLIEDAKDIGIY